MPPAHHMTHNTRHPRSDTSARLTTRCDAHKRHGGRPHVRTAQIHKPGLSPDPRTASAVVHTYRLTARLSTVEDRTRLPQPASRYLHLREPEYTISMHLLHGQATRRSGEHGARAWFKGSARVCRQPSPLAMHCKGHMKIEYMGVTSSCSAAYRGRTSRTTRPCRPQPSPRKLRKLTFVLLPLQRASKAQRETFRPRGGQAGHAPPTSRPERRPCRRA
eukprot:2045845-Prymnesium_polylepis.1